ncbi:unnamed protein product [Eretmochelys imbricata]
MQPPTPSMGARATWKFCVTGDGGEHSCFSQQEQSDPSPPLGSFLPCSPTETWGRANRVVPLEDHITTHPGLIRSSVGGCCSSGFHGREQVSNSWGSTTSPGSWKMVASDRTVLSQCELFYFIYNM